MARRGATMWMLAALVAVAAGEALIEDAHVTPLLAWASTSCLGGRDAGAVLEVRQGPGPPGSGSGVWVAI